VSRGRSAGRLAEHISTTRRGEVSGQLAAVLELFTIVELLERIEALGVITTSERFEALLSQASRHLTELLDSDCCAISELVGETLVETGSYATLAIADGRAYFLDDYPATLRVLVTRAAEVASLEDSFVDPCEAFLLRQLGLRSVLILPLVVKSRSWGLVEVYRATSDPFREEEIALARLFVAHLAGLIAQRESHDKVRRLYRETLASLANALEAKDPVTHTHTEEVAELSVAVGRRLGLSPAELEQVELGALLHDIGKIRIPDSILGKEGALTEEEWEVMQRHPAAGESILAPISALEGVLPLVRSHQERWDGRGYPDRLVGQQTPLGARIISVCDAFSAMSEDRPYHAKQTREQALRELRANAGTQFDPACVEALLAVLLEEDGRDVSRQAPLRQPRPVRLASEREGRAASPPR